MHSLTRNLTNVSDENGGQLSLERLMGYPYCEMSWVEPIDYGACCFCCDLEDEGEFTEDIRY